MNNLLSITDVIAQKHPNIMASFKEFNAALAENAYKPRVMYDIGEEVGNKIFLSKYKSLKVDDSIEQILKKIVLPTIEPFSLAKIKTNELHVTMCPFCIHIKEAASSAQCHFLSGLICGLISPKQQVTVTEVQCRAQKASACVFSINKKY